ncbi:Beta propeller domain protein [uncultured archaeon]|nr:Beta propeller domain protein [uncultured archaeon]
MQAKCGVDEMNKAAIFTILALSLMLLLAGCAQNATPGQNKSMNTSAKPGSGTQTGAGMTAPPSSPGTVYVPQGVPPAQVVGVAYNASEFMPASFDPARAVRTQSFASMDDLHAFAAHYGSSGTTYYYPYRGGVMYDLAVGVKSAEGAMPTTASAPTPAAAPSNGATGSAQAPGYSGTNNQVENVDEADLLKTDGNYIYTVTENTLYIVKAYPGENANVVSTIQFAGSENPLADSSGSSASAIRCLLPEGCLPPVYQTGYQPQELFVLGNHLAVFGTYRNSRFYADTGLSPRYGLSFFNIYDISDRSQPKLVKEYKMEGNYFRARMVGNYTYFITKSQLAVRPNPIPLRYDGEKPMAMQPSDIYYYNVPYQNPAMVNIHAINLADVGEAPSSKALVVEDSQELYMNENHLYFTYTDTINPYELMQDVTYELAPKYVNLSEGDKSLMAKINATDDEVVSPAEKRSRIMDIYNQYLNLLPADEQSRYQDDSKALLKEKLAAYAYREYTVLNEVGVDGPRIVPLANGQVPGHINNQFSLDEYGGVLRLATTLSQTWSYYGIDDMGPQNSSSNIYTLNASTLAQMDAKMGIASGESIYSTRFMGDRLYLVTYRQVDPFFAYDLSNPRDIRELGALKVPGFSRYLHPYDNHTIIGIGQDATSSGRTTGLKISLFDVSDVAHPKEVAKYVASGRYVQSTAEWEHRAFLFSKEKNLLVIPAYNYDYQNRANNFNGALVFDIEANAITLRGLVDHSKAISSDYYYSPAVERSLYIDSDLYTKSPHLLRINALDDLHSVQNVTLDAAASGGMKVY